MKQQLEKIQALLDRHQIATAQHEIEQLIEDFDDTATKARLAPMLYAKNKELIAERDALLAERDLGAKNECE